MTNCQFCNLPFNNKENFDVEASQMKITYPRRPAWLKIVANGCKPRMAMLSLPHQTGHGVELHKVLRLISYTFPSLFWISNCAVSWASLILCWEFVSAFFLPVLSSVHANSKENGMDLHFCSAPTLVIFSWQPLCQASWAIQWASLRQ